jgi:hypothetical protein
VYLEGADLRLAFFDAATALNDVVLTSHEQGTARLADVRWGDANLSVVDWTALHEVGDERAAREWTWKPAYGQEGTPAARRRAHLDAYREAVRAYRQLAVALQTQGLNEEAAHFAFRAQHLQRQVLRRQGRIGGYLFSLLLAAVSGYGYRLGQILVAYSLVVLLFAGGFLGTGLAAGHTHLSTTAVLDALQISLNAIHGRVFFAQFGLDTAQSWMATGESIIGIVIEGVFVAMLIQRFFGR